VFSLACSRVGGPSKLGECPRWQRRTDGDVDVCSGLRSVPLIADVELHSLFSERYLAFWYYIPLRWIKSGVLRLGLMAFLVSSNR
jgi:hypothetical protein